jgi:endonuclease/exonuclease/phosphatase family metal-dependent hydrolase
VPAHNAPSTLRVTLDGDISEWPTDAAAFVDEHNLYLRFTVADEQFTLQGADESVVVSLDLDASTDTGEVGELAPYNDMGTDMEIRFSPERADGSRGKGVVVEAIDAAGNRTKVDIGDLDLQVAPTYAAGWYELRMTRTPDHAEVYPKGGLRSTGFVKGVVSLRGDQDKVIGYADPFVLPVEVVCPDGRRYSGVDVPMRPPVGARVMSYNVEKSSPMRNPDVFKRVITALDPDVILMQEWEDGDAATVQAWLTLNVPTAPEWFVIKPPGDNAHGGGVLVASRYRLEPLMEAPVTTGFNGRPVRFVGAVVHTPTGEVLAGSVHLKCCGTKDSSEDRERMLEARVINEAFAAAAAGRPKAKRVIAGDFNLVGSRPPLDLMRAKLDADGGDLAVADARDLAERIYRTWRDPSTGFGPGRLDYVLYSQSNSKAADAFVFDTSRLNDAALARLGLDRTDCSGSDHLPVIVDLAW